MAHVVVFRLEAPLAAFGDIAVGERRTTHRHPAASAILGLVGAALGLRREDEGHLALARDWRVAVRLDGRGAPLADFHTAQAPPQRRNRRFATRRAELANPRDLSTVVSRRDYWTDCAFTIALWPGADPLEGPDAAAIAAALTRPAWALYAGRRSCPLSSPLAARALEARTLREAFDAWDAAETTARAAGRLPTHTQGDAFALDESFAPTGPLAAAFAGLHLERAEARRDQLVSRTRWQFAPRNEVLALRPKKSKEEQPA